MPQSTQPTNVEQRTYPALAVAAGSAPQAKQTHLLSVVRALQRLGATAHSEDLLATLAELALSETQAQKGFVILRRDDGLTIETAGRLDENALPVIDRLPSPPVASSTMLASSIVDHVARVREAVIVHDPAEMPQFSQDTYVAANKPTSILCLPMMTPSSLVGVLYVETAKSGFTADQPRVLEAFASHAATWLENDRLLAQAKSVRVDAESNARRSNFLAEAGEILSRSLEYKEVIARFARLAVHGFADWCVIVLYERGELRRVGGAHVDPRKEPSIDQLDSGPPDERIPVIRAIRTRQPVLLEGLQDAPLPTTDNHARIVRALGASTALAVPILLRDQPVGGITIVAASPTRRFEPADVEVLQELARRAAIAIDNARLYANAQEAIRLRDEFLTVASHELRTPMTSLTLAIQGVLDLGEGECLKPDMLSRSAHAAERQVQKLSRLIGELLDVTWIESGRLALELEEVELGALVREVLEQFALDLGRANCRVSLRASRAVVGRWDRSRLEQVVTNLLSNAIKFGRGHPIEIVVDAEAGAARLSIEDHGIGIRPEQQQRIFERFGRAVSAHHYGGLGLGLYISRRIIEAHHGSIHLQSQPGHGSKFTVEVPCEPG